MAKKSTPAPAAVNLTEILATIVAATTAGNFVHVNAATVQPLVDGGMIELNPAITNEAGEVAARATPAGIAGPGAAPQAPGAAAPAHKPNFAIEVSAPLPEKKRAGGRTDTYPFADLPAPVGEGEAKMTGKFFVPASAEKPEPWNSLSSTVSAASKRYATKSGEETYKAKDGTEKTRDTFTYERKFRIFEGEKAGVKGAWIERTL